MAIFSTLTTTPLWYAFWIFSFMSMPIQLVLAQSGVHFDIVLSGGRVIDPESKMDEVKNIGIKDGRIIEITSNALSGEENIDVSGLVVSPGFIDLHVHGITNQEQEFQVRDGVTTALELEAGVPLLKDWYKSRESKALINYGASVSWATVRVKGIEQADAAIEGLKQEIASGNFKGFAAIMGNSLPIFSSEISGGQLNVMQQNIRESLNEGGIGIGLPVGYIPNANSEEVLRVYQVASEMQVPVFAHVRSGGTIAIQEAIANAVLTGAPLHIVHINSMALDEIGLALEMVSMTNVKGFDISAELYPYTAASTGLKSAMFDPGWQEKIGINYEDLQLVATGERLNKETFDKYRQEGGMVIAYIMKPEWINIGLSSKNTIIASDGMPYSKLAHPRTAGTFSRVLGKYVREEQLLSLNEALEKMTLSPARRLESAVPGMRFKGRIQVGCDADITIFNPKTIIDKATFERGLAFSEGIEFVLVNGVFVVKNGETLEDVFPGKPVYGKYKK